MMRVVERTARRSGLTLRYSQGFNPRPRLSLVPPRPVGVATQDDLLVLTLDEPETPERLLEQLNAHTPAGMELLEARELTGRGTPRPVRAHYELPLDPPRAEAVRDRVSQLEQQAEWSVQRELGKDGRTRSIDLRPLVESLSVGDTGMLHAVLAPRRDAWARPGELLGLLGLDERADLARMTRCRVEY